MLVRGLDNKEIDNYFSGMMTEKEMRPYIEGARRQGYRHLTLAMIHPTCLHLCTKLLSKARKGDAIHPEKSALFTIY